MKAFILSTLVLTSVILTAQIYTPGSGSGGGAGGATNGIQKLNGFGTNTTIVTKLTVSGQSTVTGGVRNEGSVTNISDTYMSGNLTQTGANKDITGWDDIIGDYISGNLGITSSDWLNVLPAVGSTERPVIVYNTNIAANPLWQISTNGHITGSGSYRWIGGAAPSTTLAGQLDFDNNAWAASYGALQLYNGTANTYLIGVDASDTPSNGEVPTFNTAGNITWETPAGGGDVTAASTFGTDNVLIRSDGTGKGVQSSGITISDSDVMDISVASAFGGDPMFSVLHNGTASGVTISTNGLLLATSLEAAANLTAGGDTTLGSASTSLFTLQGRTTIIPADMNDGSVRTNEGSKQFMRMISGTSGTNITASSGSTNDYVNLTIEGDGNDFTFMGMRYFTQNGTTYGATITWEGGTTNLFTDMTGVREYASAANVHIDADFGMKHSISNRLAANCWLVLSNQLAEQELRVRAIGAAAGGSDYTMTITNGSSGLFGNLDAFGGTGLTNNLVITVTNGNNVEINAEMVRLNGTNYTLLVTRQYKF